MEFVSSPAIVATYQWHSPSPQKGDTPLMLAAHEGHVEIADFLLGRGANVNAKNKARGE